MHLSKLIGGLIFIASILATWYWMQYQNFLITPLQLPPGGVVYHFETGSSVARLGLDLSEQGIIEHPLMLRVLARSRDQANLLKAGEYQFVQGLTPPQLLDLLASGKVVQHAITLVEGWTFKQTLQAIRENQILVQTLEELSPSEIMTRLGYPETHPEGRFYPDTYYFHRGSSDLELLKRAYTKMDELLTREWVQRAPDLPFKSQYEALILASIVERETALPEERSKIAGVFIRRLQKGMRLQTDPTVIYGMGDSYAGNIRRKDLEQDTPYNTYVHQGLPPTPIAMPGVDAIQAVLHPLKGEELYFVAMGDGGRHYFSTTLDEHNKAVRKYQLGKD